MDTVLSRLPFKGFAWCAYLENETEGDLLGWGETPDLAVLNLLKRLADEPINMPGSFVES